jgi:hypothetical protein
VLLQSYPENESLFPRLGTGFFIGVQSGDALILQGADVCEEQDEKI